MCLKTELLNWLCASSALSHYANSHVHQFCELQVRVTRNLESLQQLTLSNKEFSLDEIVVQIKIRL
jgi:ABC-type uncharacterized transport system substrate-binding protein